MLGTKYHSPGEDIDHRVNPVLLVAIRKRHHFNSVGEERPVKKSVEEKHLTLGWNMNRCVGPLHQREALEIILKEKESIDCRLSEDLHQ